MYSKIKLNFPQIEAIRALNLAVKAKNDKNGDNRSVPSLTVLLIIPRFPIISSNIPTQKERMLVLSEAQMEMNAIVAERIILAISPGVFQPQLM